MNANGTRDAFEASPAIPADREGPVFREPWEAQAFAMTVALHERGHFAWTEWTAALSGEIAGARARGETDDGERYYEYWLAALEKLIAGKDIATRDELSSRKEAWREAAEAAPHGEPIRLAEQARLRDAATGDT